MARERGVEPALPASRGESAAAPTLLQQVPLEALTNWRIEPRGIVEVQPSQGVSVEYVSTTSSSREVPQWSQPLMRIDGPDTITLWMRGDGADREFAVERRTESGLRGRLLYFPAILEDTPTAVVRSVKTSAEGGRFLQHEVIFQLADATGLSSTPHQPVVWVNVLALSALLLEPEETSLELRAVATLVIGIA